MDQFLTVDNISQKERDDYILNNISFSVDEFQHTAIMGETGSGKSSLMKILAGHVSPVTGDVYFKGERLLRIPEEKLIRGHKGIAYLNQQSELPGFLTVAQVLEYVNELPEPESKAIYEVCQISHLLTRRTDQLSGGEKQRIALARLLTTKPSLLLLDEPFSSSDTIHKELLKEVMHDIGKELGVTTIMIAHDPQDTLSWAGQLIVMREGRIIQTGTPAGIYFSPVNEYVAGLGGAYNFIPASMAEAFLTLWDIEHIAGDLIIRPEHLELTNDDDHPLFRVISSRFYGSYGEILVADPPFKLRVRVGDFQVKAGEVVRIKLVLRGLHFLS